MTIDEAIRHCEEVAEEKEQEAKEAHVLSGMDCMECAKEHRQLAKWLKELKAFRSGINCSTCKYREVDGIDHPCIYCHPSENRWEYGGAEE